MVFIDRRTGDLRTIYVGTPVNTDGLDVRRFIAAETLRGLALSAYMARGAMPQAEIVVDEVTIGGRVDPRHPKSDAYGALKFDLLPDPRLEMELIGTEDHGRLIAGADAVTGKAYAGEKVVPFGGSDAVSGPIPSAIDVGTVRGRISSSNRTLAAPAGGAAFARAGTRLFAGRFDVRTGTLWLRRTKSEPYRAFRPDAGLRTALAAQVRRTEALGRKG